MTSGDNHIIFLGKQMLVTSTCYVTAWVGWFKSIFHKQTQWQLFNEISYWNYLYCWDVIFWKVSIMIYIHPFSFFFKMFYLFILWQEYEMVGPSSVFVSTWDWPKLAIMLSFDFGKYTLLLFSYWNLVLTSFFGTLVYWLGGLCIVYFKRYDTYHDTHQAISDMYQRYILSGFRPKKIIYPQISWDLGYFNDQNILN